MYANAQIMRTIQNRFALNIFRRLQSTQLNHENSIAAEKHLYPLEGIRILDLTRIGYFSFQFRVIFGTFLLLAFIMIFIYF